MDQASSESSSSLKRNHGSSLASENAHYPERSRSNGHAKTSRPAFFLDLISQKLVDRNGKSVKWNSETAVETGISGSGTSGERAAATGEADSGGAESEGAYLPTYLVPSADRWFDAANVSAFEKRMLPEFFTGQNSFKTPETYLLLRNNILRMWETTRDAHSSAAAAAAAVPPYLTATACRRRLAGDAGTIMRVHDFLERFGVINAAEVPPDLSGVTPASSAHAHHQQNGVFPAFDLELPSFPPRFPQPLDVWGWDYSSNNSSRTVSSGNPKHNSSAAAAAFSADGSRKTVKGMRQLSGSGGGGERAGTAWTEEMVLRLVEAAGRNPKRPNWVAVAAEVGRGLTPTECLRKFLGLSAEELLGGAAESSDLALMRTPEDLPALLLVYRLLESCDANALAAAMAAAADVNPSARELLQIEVVGNGFSSAPRSDSVSGFGPSGGEMPASASAQAVEANAERRSGREEVAIGISVTADAAPKAKSEAATAEGTATSSSAQAAPLPDNLAAAALLGAATAKARKMAEEKEKEVEGLFADMFETRLRRLEAKLLSLE